MIEAIPKHLFSSDYVLRVFWLALVIWKREAAAAASG
jgi:hypothetical protein